VKLIRDKHTGQLQGYGFVEFMSRATAERVLQTYNGTMMPNVELPFRLNWASAGEKRDDTPDYTIFVGDLAADVTDYILQETFRVHYPSVKGAKVVTDKLTMRPKGYGFVKFGDPNEQARAMTEMNGMLCSTRPMRIGPAANKKATGVQEKGVHQMPFESILAAFITFALLHVTGVECPASVLLFNFCVCCPLVTHRYFSVVVSSACCKCPKALFQFLNIAVVTQNISFVDSDHLIH
jgi:RNA recognition motif-containing protein